MLCQVVLKNIFIIIPFFVETVVSLESLAFLPLTYPLTIKSRNNFVRHAFH